MLFVQCIVGLVGRVYSLRSAKREVIYHWLKPSVTHSWRQFTTLQNFTTGKIVQILNSSVAMQTFAESFENEKQICRDKRGAFLVA